ncbi:hypothetical protein GCM10011445_01520 [Pseudocitrobacter faecalis]|nr:hypothetical protein GCM10011445_01520 [Pseudocitrobacter faecalis]
MAIVTITVTTGTVAAGATGTTGIVTINGVTAVGIAMTMAGIAVGIIVKPMSAVITMVAMTGVDVARDVVMVMVMGTGSIINLLHKAAGRLLDTDDKRNIA